MSKDLYAGFSEFNQHLNKFKNKSCTLDKIEELFRYSNQWAQYLHQEYHKTHSKSVPHHIGSWPLNNFGIFCLEQASFKNDLNQKLKISKYAKNAFKRALALNSDDPKAKDNIAKAEGAIEQLELAVQKTVHKNYVEKNEIVPHQKSNAVDKLETKEIIDIGKALFKFGISVAKERKIAKQVKQEQQQMQKINRQKQEIEIEKQKLELKEKEIDLKIKIMQKGQEFQFVEQSNKSVIDSMRLDNQDKRLDLIKRITKFNNKHNVNHAYDKMVKTLLDEASQGDVAKAEGMMIATASMLGHDSSAEFDHFAT